MRPDEDRVQKEAENPRLTSHQPSSRSRLFVRSNRSVASGPSLVLIKSHSTDQHSHADFDPPPHPPPPSLARSVSGSLHETNVPVFSQNKRYDNKILKPKITESTASDLVHSDTLEGGLCWFQTGQSRGIRHRQPPPAFIKLQ